jgi:hypothetical protein
MANELLARSRTAYERGRLLLGLQRSLLVVPMSLFSLGCCGRPSLALPAALVLAIAVVGFTWHGRMLDRAVLPGLMAGSAGLVLPVLAAALCKLTGGAIGSHAEFLACALSGVGSGVAVVYASTGIAHGRIVFLLAGSFIALLAGSLGCIVIGATGLFVLLAGVAIGTVPAALSVSIRGH